jgi:predicted DNA-binding transcriptional regulator AlpA
MSDKESTNRLLVRKAELAKQLGYSTYTIDRWVRQGKFPRPIFITDGSPAQWQPSTIAAWLAKRAAARRKNPGWRGRAK